MPQWITREYIARRSGAKFRPDQLTPARCPLLGMTLASMLVEGVQIGPWFLEVALQPEVGVSGYDAGARVLTEFFRRELTPYLEEAELDPVGRTIIDCCLRGGTVEDYVALLAAD